MVLQLTRSCCEVYYVVTVEVVSYHYFITMFFKVAL
jgi:hypothetical protein